MPHGKLFIEKRGSEVGDLFKLINSTHCVLYSELAQLGQKQDLKLHGNTIKVLFNYSETFHSLIKYILFIANLTFKAVTCSF